MATQQKNHLPSAHTSLKRERLPQQLISVKPSLGRLLACTDFLSTSAPALTRAVRLARSFNAQLTVLYVGGMFTRKSSFLKGVHDPEAQMNETLRAIRSEGVSAQSIIRDGKPSQIILQIADEQEIDAIVVATHEAASLERFVVGATAEEVLRQAACPVITVGPAAVTTSTEGEHNNPVVFATDFHSPMTEAITHAVRVARGLDTSLHCIHVLPLSMKEGGARAGAASIVPTIMSSALKHLVEGCRPCSAACVITYDSEISRAVVEYARQHGAEMIVLGVRRERWMTSHLLPRCLVKMLISASCPVLTVAFEDDGQQSAAPGRRDDCLNL